jgi:hypothetical protein
VDLHSGSGPLAAAARAALPADRRVELDPDTAWRLCTRGITPGQAAGRARVDGDRQLAAAALQIVSIIWSPPGSDT